MPEPLLSQAIFDALEGSSRRFRVPAQPKRLQKFVSRPGSLSQKGVSGRLGSLSQKGAGAKRLRVLPRSGQQQPSVGRLAASATSLLRKGGYFLFRLPFAKGSWREAPEGSPAKRFKATLRRPPCGVRHLPSAEGRLFPLSAPFRQRKGGSRIRSSLLHREIHGLAHARKVVPDLVVRKPDQRDPPF